MSSATKTRWSSMWSPAWLSFWTVTIQQLNGSKTNVRLPNPHQMRVVELREVVKDALSIDTDQQIKLTIHDVVLEDRNERGAAMRITDYPKFHDGITVYLIVQLEVKQPSSD